MNDPLNEPNHAVVDLETLGTDPYAPILAIGACAFRVDDNVPITDAFYQAVALDSCLQLGLRPSASTIQWWMDQAEGARKAAFNDPQAVTLPLALDAFTDWLNSRPLKLWGNSARFDLGLLEAAYKACGKEVPWHFRDERCYRTIKTLPGARVIELERFGTHHNALDDALSQALHLRAISQQLHLQM
jgi:DNA polymerase III epsilon subunit-like protein